MKKTIVAILVAVLAVTFSGCGKTEKTDPGADEISNLKKEVAQLRSEVSNSKSEVVSLKGETAALRSENAEIISTVMMVVILFGLVLLIMAVPLGIVLRDQLKSLWSYLNDRETEVEEGGEEVVEPEVVDPAFKQNRKNHHPDRTKG